MVLGTTGPAERTLGGPPWMPSNVEGSAVETTSTLEVDLD